MGIQQNIEIEDLVGAYPICGECGQANIMREARTHWSLLTRAWTLKSLFDTFACDDCGSELIPVWRIDKEFRLKRIVRLNDALRHGQGTHSTVVATAGIRQYGETYLARVSHAVATFDQFNEENDPRGEHDFGAITIDNVELFWKVDYFDLDLNAQSPDKANPDITHRVLTIMFANEY